MLVTGAAAASLDRPRSTGLTDKPRLALGKGLLPRDTTEVPTPAQVELTPETEVFLDDRSCRYRDVPSTASVTRMVLAPDGKTVTRIEFRTRR